MGPETPKTKSKTDQEVRPACGIPLIDSLYSGDSARPIGRGDDIAAVGAVQDLLCGHGYRGMPSLGSSAYGVFGPKTSAAILDFQAGHGLTSQDCVDRGALTALVTEPAPDPRASQAYLALALRMPFGGMLRCISMVAQMEGMGRFAAMNLNTDRAGLSFGIIQWAQQPGRLAEILAAFQAADPSEFASIFGAGDARLANRLLAHARKPRGGLDSAGRTTDPAFNLIEEPWVSRFRESARNAIFQRAQVKTALAAFAQNLQAVRDAAPDVASERGIAFLLDVANQFGAAGMRRLCRSCRRDGMTESDLLETVADETVESMPPAFQIGVRARRDVFLNTPLLTDAAFAEA